LFGIGLWSKSIVKKYLKGVDVIFWLHSGNFKCVVASNFWRNFLSTLSLLKKWLVWSVGLGVRVLVGQDPFVGVGTTYKLSNGLLQHIHSLKIFSLAHACHSSQLNLHGSQDWLTSSDLWLVGDLEMEWNAYVLKLRYSGVSLSCKDDSIVWSWNLGSGVVTVKSSYEALVDQNTMVDPVWWHKALWKVHVPLKIILFVWLCLHDCILTGENYRHRGGIDPFVCTMCLKDAESTQHLLVTCDVS
jgi:hypothetical protein